MGQAGNDNKATIRNLETDEEIPCMYKPKEYTFSKTNTWNKKDVKEGNVPMLDFGGGDNMTLEMELFFDTYEDGKDVRKHTDKVWKLMTVPSGKKEPPMCEFRWGHSWSFKAVITSLTQKFTLFLADGTPVRSTMTVKFKQALEDGKYPGQNPTTISKPGYKARRVLQGETLDVIAFDEYGDPALWRFLADINHLDNPMKLRVGQVLAIAPLN